MEKEAIETRTSSFASGEAPAEPKISIECGEIMRAIEVVERDSVAIAESYNSLFSSLRLALSEVTTTSVENMQCFSDVVGQVQESALDAATKGNRYINSCLRGFLESLRVHLFPSKSCPIEVLVMLITMSENLRWSVSTMCIQLATRRKGKSIDCMSHLAAMITERWQLLVKNSLRDFSASPLNLQAARQWFGEI